MPEGNGQSLRLTYAQLAEARGISKASAERLVRSRKWPRILGNDGVAIVIVPPGETFPGSGGGSGSGKPGRHRRPRTLPHDPPPDTLLDIRGAIEVALAPLREQLEHERGRADRAEQHIEAIRNELTEARVAERGAIAEAADLRRRLDQADTDHRQALDRLAAAQERIAALLTDQRTPSPPEPSPRRRWWRWR
jgi:hypothetical protein